MRETLPLLKLYKTLILIAIVAGPIYWLMFTTDGKLRTDSMVLWLAGGESVDLNFQALDGLYSEQDWKKVYPDLPWSCKSSNSSFGSSLCFADIASYNGIPAQYLTIFFREGKTSAVKLVYRDQYHNEIGLDLQTQLGQPEQSNLTDGDSSPGAILQWKTVSGMVLLKKALARNEEPVLMWLAAGAG